MTAPIEKLIGSLKAKGNPSINHQQFNGLDSIIDEYEVVANLDQEKLTCLFSIIKKAYPWAGLSHIEVTKIFIECPASLQLMIESKKSFFSRERKVSVQTSDARIRQMIQTNQAIVDLFKEAPSLVICTTNKILSQSFNYPSRAFVLGKMKAIPTQDQLAQLIRFFRELLFILNKLD